MRTFRRFLQLLLAEGLVGAIPLLGCAASETHDAGYLAGSDAGGSLPGAGTTGGSTATQGDCPDADAATFTFFLTSKDGLAKLAGNADGFGGNLGGLPGADEKCRQLAIASTSQACEAKKTWRAFLSTSSVNAIDRIGEGPWFDRRNRRVASSKADLLGDRPVSADPAIKNDLPNEFGFPNHTPYGDGRQFDNHEILTGTGADGKVYSQTGRSGWSGASTSCGSGGTWSVEAATCWGWTSAAGQGCPRVGKSWPRNDGLDSGTNWMSAWNEGGCAPGGPDTESGRAMGLDGTPRVGSAGGYGGFYCFASPL